MVVRSTCIFFFSQLVCTTGLQSPSIYSNTWFHTSDIPCLGHMIITKPCMRHCFTETELPENEEEELLSWEALMKDRYLLSTQQEQSQSMERRILDTAQK